MGRWVTMGERAIDSDGRFRSFAGGEVGGESIADSVEAAWEGEGVRAVF